MQRKGEGKQRDRYEERVTEELKEEQKRMFGKEYV